MCWQCEEENRSLSVFSLDIVGVDRDAADRVLPLMMLMPVAKDMTSALAEGLRHVAVIMNLWIASAEK